MTSSGEIADLFNRSKQEESEIEIADVDNMQDQDSQQLSRDSEQK
jgi:hypothetical protein